MFSSLESGMALLAKRLSRPYIGQGEHKEMLAKAEEDQEGKEVEGGG